MYIKLDSTIYGPQKTGQNGVVLFEYFPVPEDRNRVMCLTEGHTDGDIIYVATAKGFLDIIGPAAHHHPYHGNQLQPRRDHADHPSRGTAPPFLPLYHHPSHPSSPTPS